MITYKLDKVKKELKGIPPEFDGYTKVCGRT
jgi:hypothetical protein